MDFLSRLGVVVFLIGGGVIALTVTVFRWAIAKENQWVAVVLGLVIWLVAAGVARVWVWICMGSWRE